MAFKAHFGGKFIDAGCVDEGEFNMIIDYKKNRFFCLSRVQNMTCDQSSEPHRYSSNEGAIGHYGGGLPLTHAWLSKWLSRRRCFLYHKWLLDGPNV